MPSCQRHRVFAAGCDGAPQGSSQQCRFRGQYRGTRSGWRWGRHGRRSWRCGREAPSRRCLRIASCQRAVDDGRRPVQYPVHHNLTSETTLRGRAIVPTSITGIVSVTAGRSVVARVGRVVGILSSVSIHERQQGVEGRNRTRGMRQLTRTVKEVSKC